jgi:predicted nucleotidyltransferase
MEEAAQRFLDGLVAACREDGRILGLLLAGSTATGQMDEFSDVDTVIVSTDESHPELLASAHEFAAGLGPLLVAFTGEHVGEPRLLIALYGPPLLHVDLKFVASSDLAVRVEDGVVTWERDGLVTAALAGSAAVWPTPDPQWLEDRFWVWVHYCAAKIGRGELFECLDGLGLIRSVVLGPLLALRAGARPQGARRLERLAPEEVPALAATIGDHSVAGCADALHAAIALYRSLRDPAVERREAAEEASVAYLEDVASRAARASR